MSDISSIDWPVAQKSPSQSVHPDLVDWPAEHVEKTWDQWTFAYDDISDREREELARLGARIRENIERNRARNSPQWSPDDYNNASDTDDDTRARTGLLTPDREPRARPPPPSNPVRPSASELNQAPAPSPVLTADEYAAKRAAEIEARLDEAALGPVEDRPVVDSRDNTKRYAASIGLWHDLWGTRHNTRFEKRRRSYLFALNDAGQPVVVTAGDDDSTCGFSSLATVSLVLTKLCLIAGLYDPESLAIGEWEKLRDAGLVTFSEESFLDFIMDYVESPECKKITGGAKIPNPKSEAFFQDRRKLRDAQNSRKRKGNNTQRIEKGGRRSRGSGKKPRR